MNSEEKNPRVAIILAIIGAVSTLGVALFNNLDYFSPKPEPNPPEEVKVRLGFRVIEVNGKPLSGVEVTFNTQPPERRMTVDSGYTYLDFPKTEESIRVSFRKEGFQFSEDYYQATDLQAGPRIINLIKENPESIQENPPEPREPVDDPIVLTPDSQLLTENEAVELIDNWLKAKQQIYGPGYNTEIAKDYATGNLLKDIENPNAGAVTWLRNNQSYWIYQDSRVDRVWGFAPDRENPHILVSIYEGRTLYKSGKPTGTQEPKAKSFRYYFQKDSSGWKIRDYCVCQDDSCDPISGCEPPYDHRN
jgi:hypothetical protein